MPSNRWQASLSREKGVWKRFWSFLTCYLPLSCQKSKYKHPDSFVMLVAERVQEAEESVQPEASLSADRKQHVVRPGRNSVPQPILLFAEPSRHSRWVSLKCRSSLKERLWQSCGSSSCSGGSQVGCWVLAEGDKE